MEGIVQNLLKVKLDEINNIKDRLCSMILDKIDLNLVGHVQTLLNNFANGTLDIGNSFASFVNIVNEIRNN